MPCTTAPRILVAGHSSPSTSFTLQELARIGCAFQSVDTVAQAEAALRAAPFDIVLAGEMMSDGRGYDLTDWVVKRSATLLVSIALSEACLWLPVVQHGVRTLGERALNSHTLQSEITALLAEKAAAAKAPVAHTARGFMPEPAAHRLMAGLDRRTGPEERRGLFVKAAPEPKKLPRSQFDDDASGATAAGPRPRERSGDNSVTRMYRGAL